MPDPAIEAIIRQHRPGPSSGADAIELSVANAAYSAARHGKEQGGSTVDRIAGWLGATLVAPRRSSAHIEGRELQDGITEAFRTKYNFGDIPAPLVHDVVTSVSQLIPDHMSADAALRLAGLTTITIAQKPDIGPNELRVLVGGLAEAPQEMDPVTLTVLDAAVTMAHHASTQYYQQQPAAAQRAA